MFAARGIGHGNEHVAVCDRFHLLKFAPVALELDRVSNAVLPATELEPRLDHVHHRDRRAGQSSEFQSGQTDRTRSDDQYLIAFAACRTIVRVAANGERFHKSQLLVAELRRRMQFVGTDQKSFA